ncbi:MAG: hypothetical protein HYT89_04155 [Candidatus Omnitrophica bacterium]|nr:hypothetical protein [Candidatus Omnitrophota bacterium]
MAILEEIRSNFRTFGEGLSDVQEKTSDISDRLGHVEQKLDQGQLEIKAIRSVLPTLATNKDLEKFSEEFNRRLTTLESAR